MFNMVKKTNITTIGLVAGIFFIVGMGAAEANLNPNSCGATTTNKAECTQCCIAKSAKNPHVAEKCKANCKQAKHERKHQR